MTISLPYLPAKTITGVWRDACEAIAAGLDQGRTASPTWSEWLYALFGTQPALADDDTDFAQPILAARLSVRSGRLPAALRGHLQTQRALAQAVTFIKPGVKIDRETGQALDDFLRFEEVVRGGAVLTADWTLFIEGFSDVQAEAAAQNNAAYALLWAGTKAIERLGGKRRRGLGRCEWLLACTQEEEQEFLQILQGNPPRLPVLPKNPEVAIVAAPPAASIWISVPLVLELRTPVVVADRTIGNMVQSLDFVPGTSLLAPITQALGKVLGRSLLPEVARGDLQVTNAYLEVGGKRGLPVPLSLFYPKQQGGLDKADGRVWNRLTETASSTESWQLKQHRAGYVGAFHPNEQQLPLFDRTPMQQRTHNTVEDLLQRPTEAVGGVYTYGAIKAGTRLLGALRLRQPLVEALHTRDANWAQTLTGEVCLGVAKKDEYGLAKLTAGQPETLDSTAVASGDTLTLWLLSDVLVRDVALRYATAVAQLQQHLQSRLPVTLRPRAPVPLIPPLSDEGYDVGGSEDKVLSGLVRPSRTDGWHVRWGLPRPSYLGLMAGSCLVFEIVDGSLTTADLQRVEREGLGERRAEGFGEVGFNHPLVTSKLAGCKARQVIAQAHHTGLPAPIAPYDPIHAYARLIETSAWRETIRRTAEALGSDPRWRREHFFWSRHKPTNSQLGALRSAVTPLRTWDDRQHVLGWLSNLEASTRGEEKWPRQAREAIRQLLHTPQTVWHWLTDKAEPDVRATMTANARVALERELWATAVRSLVLACLRGEVRQREAEPDEVLAHVAQNRGSEG